MKKFMIMFLIMMGISVSAPAQGVKEMIVFSTECPNCRALFKDLEEDIKPAFPDLNVLILKLDNKENRDIFYKCATELKMDKRRLGIPLILIGDKHLLGWSQENKEKLLSYIDLYMKQDLTTVGEAKMKCLREK